jgi:hypothetical protein
VYISSGKQHMNVLLFCTFDVLLIKGIVYSGIEMTIVKINTKIIIHGQAIIFFFESQTKREVDVCEEFFAGS